MRPSELLLFLPKHDKNYKKHQLNLHFRRSNSICPNQSKYIYLRHIWKVTPNSMNAITDSDEYILSIIHNIFFPKLIVAYCPSTT